MKFYLLFLLFSVSVRALAQIPLPIGEHESFLGNTGVARLGSPAAAFYNPAGLATMEHTKLSASGTLFQNSVQDLKGQLTGHSDTFTSIPTQLSTTGKFTTMRWAFSVFTIRSFDLGVLINSQLPNGLGTAPARVKGTGNSLLVGPSIAIPYAGGVNLGASLFVQKDDDYINTIVRVDATGPGGQTHALVQNEQKISSYELAPVVGATWQYDADTLLGVRVNLPLLPLTGHSTELTQQVGYDVDNANNVSDNSKPAEELKENAHRDAPLAMAFGFSRALENDTKVFADVKYALKAKTRPTATDDEYTFSESFGASLGAERGGLNGTWALGAFYQQNNIRTMEGEVASYLGATLGYLKSTEHFDSGVGVSYVTGSGTYNGVTNKLSNIGLLVSSTYKF